MILYYIFYSIIELLMTQSSNNLPMRTHINDLPVASSQIPQQITSRNHQGTNNNGGLSQVEWDALVDEAASRLLRQQIDRWTENSRTNRREATRNTQRQNLPNVQQFRETFRDVWQDRNYNHENWEYDMNAIRSIRNIIDNVGVTNSTSTNNTNTNINNTCATDNTGSTDNIHTLQQINRNLKIKITEQNEQIRVLNAAAAPTTMCIICNEQARTQINSVCGHMCACAACASQLNNVCPICRQNGKFIRLIIS